MPRNDFYLCDDEELCTANMEDRRCQEEEESAAGKENQRESFRRREPLSNRYFYMCEVVS